MYRDTQLSRFIVENVYIPERIEYLLKNSGFSDFVLFLHKVREASSVQKVCHIYVGQIVVAIVI
jgi:hypothetical protein